jgi:hypothetical protein
LLATLVSEQNKLHINENYFVHKLYVPDLIITRQILADISMDITSLLLKSGGCKQDEHMTKSGCNVFLSFSSQQLSRQVSVALQYANNDDDDDDADDDHKTTTTTTTTTRDSVRKTLNTEAHLRNCCPGKTIRVKF